MHSNELPVWLECIESLSKKQTIVIVPGGGEFADDVRRLQKQYGFDDVIAHKMALLAMSQYGYFLQGIQADLAIIQDYKQCLEAQHGNNRPFLWIPLDIMNGASGIEASWDYTSDSIALWLAIKLNAAQLILVKSAPLTATETTLDVLMESDCLDKGFQRFSDQFSGEIYCLQKSQVEQLHLLF